MAAKMTSPEVVHLLTPTQLAEEHLHVSERTLTQWRWLGKGPRWIKVGRHIRYRLSDVNDWLVKGADGEAVLTDRYTSPPRRARTG